MPATVRDRGMAAVVRGYYESRDGGLFTACGETSRRRVVSVADDTAAALRVLTDTSVQPRFLVAQGSPIGRDEVELGTFELVSGDAWNCESRFDEFIYAARGVDAFWALEVTPASVSFVAAPDIKPALFAYRPFAHEGAEFKYSAEDANLSIAITLHPESCVDRMTDTVFAYRAAIESGGLTYSGCAWRGQAERHKQ